MDIPSHLVADIRHAQQLEEQRQRNPQVGAELIELYEQIVSQLEPDEHPNLYVSIRYSLGRAYMDLPTGNRGNNLERAIACYKEALRFYTPQTAPLEYAAIQNNLGEAYLEFPLGDHRTNLAQAIQCYQEALLFYTPQIDPLAYAQTQSNLGNAYRDLPIGDRVANLTQAIRCYQETLRFLTPEEFDRDDPWMGTGSIGAIIGTTILPGFGTVAGAAVGAFISSWFKPVKKKREADPLMLQALHNKEAAERELTNIQPTINTLPLFALARTTLEEGEKALVDKMYVLLAGLSQNKPDGEKIAQFDLYLSSTQEPLSLDVLLHTSENIKLTTERFKVLHYDPLHHNPQFVEFPFQVAAPGHCAFDIHFYHERRWLTAIQIEFETVENLQQTEV